MNVRTTVEGFSDLTESMEEYSEEIIEETIDDDGIPLDPKEIPVCGVDATAAGCQSIVDGDMQFTVYQSAAGQGEMGIKTAIALATKGSAKGLEGLSDDGTIVWVPFEPVNSSNVKDYQ